jgi:hypothetical protein
MATTELSGKVALVTGASSGIGLATCERLVELGARVAMVARTKSALDREAARLSSSRAGAFPLDVKDLGALAQLPARVVERFGRLDIVVNNAGLNHRGPAVRWSPLELSDIITVNLNAPIVLMRAAIDHLPTGGAIVNVASLAGFIPLPHEAAYSASKAGLRAFTKALREEHPELTIGLVSPGPVDTNFFGDVRDVPDLVFSQPMSTAHQVAEAIIEVITHGTDEIAIPRASGALATVGYVVPALARRLRPILEARGAKNKAAYLKRKGH